MVMHVRVPVEERVRELFGRPRAVDVRVRGQCPAFERANLVAVDLVARTLTFRRWDHLDWRTDPCGHHTRLTEKTFRMDDTISWTDWSAE